MIAAFTRFDVGNLFTSPARMLVPFAFVVVAGIAGPTPLFAIAAAAAVTSLGVGTPFLNDERGHLDTLYAILPISRKTVVVGRYLAMALWFVAAAVIGTVTVVVTNLVRGEAVQPAVLVLTLAVSFCGAALALAVQLPVLFAFGFAKARAAMFLPLIVVVVLVTAAAGLGLLSSSFFAQAIASPLTPAVAVAVGVVAVVISAVVATRIYTRRQF